MSSKHRRDEIARIREEGRQAARDGLSRKCPGIYRGPVGDYTHWEAGYEEIIPPPYDSIPKIVREMRERKLRNGQPSKTLLDWADRLERLQ